MYVPMTIKKSPMVFGDPFSGQACWLGYANHFPIDGSLTENPWSQDVHVSGRWRCLISMYSVTNIDEACLYGKSMGIAAGSVGHKFSGGIHLMTPTFVFSWGIIPPPGLSLGFLMIIEALRGVITLSNIDLLTIGLLTFNKIPTLVLAPLALSLFLIP